MKYFKSILTAALFIILLIISCTDVNDQKEKTGEELSKTYCSACHLFPQPALLDKRTWKEDVLPAMAHKLGINNVYEISIPGQDPIVTINDWKKILTYYVNSAPDTMPPQSRTAINKITNLFSTKKVFVLPDKFPSTSYIKIDEGNHWIYVASSSDSTITIYDAGLKQLSHSKVNAAVVDINFDSSLLIRGRRKGILTNIGLMNPNDGTTGSADIFNVDEKANFTKTAKILKNIARPVQISRSDIDGDGQQDYLVCAFGNTTGAFYWMKSNGSKGFEQKILSPLPGAIAAYINDINNDGLPDIIVLMAQAQEGIFLYLNKGHGVFETKKLLGFPPVYGSSSFELIDFNNDGYKDLLYTCGDNADYSGRVLKYYHGVYIYLNDGKNNFTQKYFFPIHGCYKAMAKDFDKDGDLDIAAISFFPDTKNQPQESFVYLEQTTPFHFTPSTVNGFDEGNWMTMDAGDMDGDGYDDIVLGSLIPPIPNKIAEWKKSNKKKAVIMLLHNERKKN